MQSSKLKQSKRNVSISIITKCVMMLLPFLIRTVIIYTLGNLYLGLDSLFSSILSMLSLSELGFSSAVVYALYKPVAEGDDKKVCGILSFYKKVYRIVGFVILGIGLLIVPILDVFIAEGTEIPQDINIYIVYIILLLNTGISYLLFAYKNAILVAAMRNDTDALIDMCRSLVSHGLQIVVLICLRNYYGYIVVLPIVTILNNLYRNYIINKRYPQYFQKSALSKEEKKDIMSRVWPLIGSKIAGVVFTSVDSIIISAFLGLEILGKYTNYYTIFTAVYGILSTAYTAIQSTVGNSLVCKDREENYKLFRKLFVGNAFLTCFCTCCFVFLYQPFMRLWVGEENCLGISIPLLLAAYYFSKGTRRICFLFKEAAGMWREDWLKPFVSVIFNLLLNILLVKLIGLPGVLISSIFAIVAIEMPWETLVFFKQYFQRSCMPYVMSIFISIVQLLLACGIVFSFVWLTKSVIVNDILILLVRLPVCVLAVSLVYLPQIKKIGGKNIIKMIKKG